MVARLCFLIFWVDFAVDDAKQMNADAHKAEAELREKYEILDKKYRNHFVREVISKKGTEEVGVGIVCI